MGELQRFVDRVITRQGYWHLPIDCVENLFDTHMPMLCPNCEHDDADYGSWGYLGDDEISQPIDCCRHESAPTFGEFCEVAMTVLSAHLVINPDGRGGWVSEFTGDHRLWFGGSAFAYVYGLHELAFDHPIVHTSIKEVS